MRWSHGLRRIPRRTRADLDSRTLCGRDVAAMRPLARRPRNRRLRPFWRIDLFGLCAAPELAPVRIRRERRWS